MQHQRGGFVVTHLPFAQKQDQWSTVTIADSMQLRVQPALVCPIRRGTLPFLADRLRYGVFFKCIASIIKCAGLPRLAVGLARMRLNTPSLLHHEAIIDRLVRPIFLGNITAPQTITQKTMPLKTSLSSTRGTPWDSGRYGSIRRISDFDNNIKSLMAVRSTQINRNLITHAVIQ